MENHLAILCEFGYLENVQEYHSSSSSSSRNCDTNLRCVKNYLWKTTGQLFRETEKLISGQTETAGIMPDQFPRSKVGIDKLTAQSSLSISTAKVYVFSDSVLCLVKMGDNPVESWEKQIQWYSDNDYFSELNRNDGQPME